MIAVGVVALLIGVVIGTVLGHTLATAPTMPTCARCQHELDRCTCYGPQRIQTRATQEDKQTDGGH